MEWIAGSLIMSVIPAHELGGATDAAPKPESFWQGLSREMDAYLADRTKKVIPAITLRRSQHEIARCRRFMRSRVAVRADIFRGRLTRS
jgi:hypothetical protein